MSHAQKNARHYPLLDRLQNVSYYPIYIFENKKRLYPLDIEEEKDLFLSDSNLFECLIESEGIVYEEPAREIFFAVKKDNGYCHVAGPFCFQTLSRAALREFTRTHHVKHAQDFHIIRASVSQALDILELAAILFRHSIRPSSKTEKDSPRSMAVSPWLTVDASDAKVAPEQLQKEYQIKQYQFENADKQIPHTPYEMELRILQAMQSSQKEEFYALLSSLDKYSSGDFASSSEKYKEYSVVSMITILTRAAISGGAAPDDAYALSDFLLLKTSNCKEESKYMDIFQEALTEFFRLTARSKEVDTTSLHVKNAKAYIAHNLNQELSPEVIAAHLGISKNHLLKLFSQSEQITLMQYILRERALAAANMLKYSDYDIMRIAVYFHFQTQSHFGVVFKKYIGMSPAAYRKKYKPIGF